MEIQCYEDTTYYSTAEVSKNLKKTLSKSPSNLFKASFIDPLLQVQLVHCSELFAGVC